MTKQPNTQTPLLLLGWSAADRQLLQPFLATSMPNLRQLLARGQSGELLCRPPHISAIQWTTIATGVLPESHGVWTEAGLDKAGELGRVGRSSRQTPAIWEQLPDSVRTAAVGWPASHPIRPGCLDISDAFPIFRAGRPSPPGSLPEHLREHLDPLRLGPGALTLADLTSFVPEITDADRQAEPDLCVALVKLISEWTAIHAAACHLRTTESPDLLAVCYRQPGYLMHRFGLFMAPRLPQVTENRFRLFQQVMPAVYALLDLQLGRLLELAGPAATVIIVSEHGCVSGAQRPLLPDGSTDYLLRHRSPGFIAVAGPRADGIEQLPTRAIEVAPFLHRLLGTAPAVAPPAAPVPVPDPDLGARQQLIALGYLRESTEPPAAQLTALTDSARQQWHAAAGLPLAEYQRRFAESATADNGLALAAAHLAAGDAAAAQAIYATIPAADLAPGQQLLGVRICARNQSPAAARAAFHRLVAGRKLPAAFWLRAAEMFDDLELPDDAGACLAQAAQLVPDDAITLIKLSQALLRKDQYLAAAGAAAQAIAREEGRPVAHLVLGLARLNLKMWPPAETALLRAVQLDPTLRRAHQALARLYRHHLLDTAKADHHHRLAQVEAPNP